MNKNSKKPIIYQVLPRIFGNMQRPAKEYGNIEENGCGKMADFTPEALDAIRQLGATHVWYTGILEHATRTDYSAYGIPKDHNAVVKGKAGSPYAVKDYYDVAPDLAVSVPDRMAEFEALVERTHEAGLKVLIDFVPNHVARQYHSDAKDPLEPDLGQNDDTSRAFARDNNFYYLPGQALAFHFGAKQEDFEYSEFPAKVTGNDCFSATPGRNDWYETVKLNYGVDYCGGSGLHADPIPDTWVKMRDILCYWAARGVDGFRCDMTELVPPAFWAWAIPSVREQYPKTLFLAEIYQPDRYGEYLHAGFDYLYDKVGVYDYLIALGKGARDSTTYATVEDYIASLNASAEWVSYDATTNRAAITGLAGFVASQKSASKDVGALDGVDRGQTENTVLGAGGTALHFSQVSRDAVAAGESAYAALSGWSSDCGSAGYDSDFAQADSVGTDVLIREQMYNPMTYLLAAARGGASSTVAPAWRIRTGIQQGDTASTVEINLALALRMAGKDVDFATVWGQGHTMAELTGSGEDNFISWVRTAASQ